MVGGAADRGARRPQGDALLPAMGLNGPAAPHRCAAAGQQVEDVATINVHRVDVNASPQDQLQRRLRCRARGVEKRRHLTVVARVDVGARLQEELDHWHGHEEGTLARPRRLQQQQQQQAEAAAAAAAALLDFDWGTMIGT